MLTYNHFLGRDQPAAGDVDQIGAVDPQKILAEQIFPLADAGLVAVGVSVGRDEAHLGVVGFHVVDVRHAQRHAPAVGEERDRALLLPKAPAQPLGPVEIADGDGGEDQGQEDGVDEHRRDRDHARELPLADEGLPAEGVQEHDEHDGGDQHGQREVDLVHGFPRLGHQVLERDRAGPEDEADEESLGQGVVQADEQGRDQREGREPIGDPSENFHGITKINKNVCDGKRKGPTGGFDGVAGGFRLAIFKAPADLCRNNKQTTILCLTLPLLSAFPSCSSPAAPSSCFWCPCC